MKTLNFPGTIFVLMAVLFFVSCEKNQAPTCRIIKPSDGYTVTKGDIITISINSDDADGTVSEVRLFLDDIGLAELEFPYNYELNTDAYSSGEMTLKVTVRDNEGLDASDEIKIIIAAAFSTVSTSEAMDITYNSAVVGGSVSDDGGGDISESGVYWDTLANPETSGHKISMASGLGDFQGSINKLPHGKKVYFRAYSMNSAGIALGEELFFETNTIPSVQSSAASDVGISSALVGGEITADGGESISERGIYWSSEPMAEVTGARLVIESEQSSFSTTLDELSVSTTYYFKAFAVNAAGEALGQEVSFSTISLATVRTVVDEASIYKQMLVGGLVSDDGGFSISETGVYWGTSPDPVSSGTRLVIGSELGSFSATLADLAIESSYYVVAFAVTGAGESVGQELSYKVPEPVMGTFTDPRDQEVYGTVIIGEQVWMSENLRATSYNDGTEIPHFDDPNDWSANTGPAYSWYNNDPGESEWGAFYTWYTIDTEKLCIDGWHVPTESEWRALEEYLGMNPQVSVTDDFRGNNEGGMLKTTDRWEAPNTGATDELGFSVIPTGRKGMDGIFLYQGQVSYFWSSDFGPGDVPFRRLFSSDEGRISRSTVRKEFGLSVRCVKD